VKLPPQPSRTVHCADALAWLREQPPLAGCSFITSLPDVSELPELPRDTWQRWFHDAATLVLSRLADDAVAIFYQSDICRDGALVDKGYLCSRAAGELGHATLFHKIVCREPPGTVRPGRPAYSHLLAFSRGVRLDLARALPDVLADGGPTSWTRGMGVEACRLACRFVLDHTRSHTIVDPFCGRGPVLAVANELGLNAVGVEINARRARAARGARVPV
jgi:hypothetical protein